MTEPGTDATIKSAAALFTQYGFETEYGFEQEEPGDQLLDHWLRTYPPRWVRLALIESLYLGRYKAISVEQILLLWSRRGQAVYHFTHEFETLVCNNLPRNLRLSPPFKSIEPTHRPSALLSEEVPQLVQNSAQPSVHKVGEKKISHYPLEMKDWSMNPATDSRLARENSTSDPGEPVTVSSIRSADAVVAPPWKPEEDDHVPQLPREAFEARDIEARNIETRNIRERETQFPEPTNLSSSTNPVSSNPVYRGNSAQVTSPIQQFQPKAPSSNTYHRLRALAYTRATPTTASPEP